jgi:osmotically-inducible protein OsmY
METRIRHSVLVVLVMSALTSSLPAAEMIANRDLQFWVEDALLNDPRVVADAIDVTADDGIVTLEGSVPTVAAKNYADLEAKKIRGVVGVIDRLSVKPVHVADEEIVLEVRRLLIDDPSVQSQDIRVWSEDGRVRLEGRVGTWFERQQAEIVASEVRGVREVVNALEVDPQPVREDWQIRNQAMAALARDVYLTDLPILVSVEDGIVTLEGVVGTQYERQRADDQVRWLAGVRSVDNLLQVDWQKDFGTRESPPKASGEALRAAVAAELAQDTRIDATRVVVTAEGERIHMAGSVPNMAQKTIALSDAREVVGVATVEDELWVESPKRADWAIRDDVLFKLATDPLLETFDIGVDVVDQVVTLSGQVDTEFHARAAMRDAARVRGVREVINGLETVRKRVIEDETLAQNVSHRLRWNWATFWVHEQITVKVRDGVATLSGDVDHWTQRQQAGEVALATDGVWAVDNRITVNGAQIPDDEWSFRGSS